MEHGAERREGGGDKGRAEERRRRGGDERVSTSIAALMTVLKRGGEEAERGGCNPLMTNPSVPDMVPCRGRRQRDDQRPRWFGSGSGLGQE